MRQVLSLLFLLITSNLFAQKQTFDLLIFTPPKGWAKEVKKNVVVFTKADKKTNTWCQIGVYKSTISKGSIDEDLKSEWDLLAAKPYNITDSMEASQTEEADGWKVKAASGKFIFDKKPAAVLLTSFSGYDRCVSIMAITNSESYINSIESFVGNIDLKKPVTTNITNNNQSSQQTDPVIPVTTTGFAFNTTNFDDGWTSTIQEDWVDVTKGNIKVLLHFPKEGTIFPADPDRLTTAAWNILVAPRYSQLTNYKTAYVEMYNRPYFGMGTVKENSSGKSVFVVLFRKGAGWMEIITPDVLSFTREFGFNPETIRWGKISDYSGGYVVDNSQGAVINADDQQVYNKLDNMFGRNKFAVAASDLNNTGRWNANYASNTFYYNYYTGNSAGMSTFSASEWYEFSSGNKYHWEAVMTNSGGGVMNAAQSKSDGAFKSLNNWQMYFSNIGGKEKTFDVYFSAIKGGRVLWVNDAKYPGSGIFTGLAKRK